MQILVNTDRTVEAPEAMATHIDQVIDDALNQYRDHITRVEVHLADENGETKGVRTGQSDKRCLMEARLEGYHPLAVTAHGESMHLAIASAADKLARLIASTLGRLHDHRRHHEALTPMPAESATEE